MLPIEEFKLKIYIICIFVGNENTDKALPLSLIHIGDNDDADNNDNNERPYLFIFQFID